MEILLKRPQSKYWVESRYKIIVNGQRVAELKVGEQREIEVASNQITIEAKGFGTSSGKQKLTVNNGDLIEIAGNRFYTRQAPFLPVLYIVLIPLYYVTDIDWIKYSAFVLLVGLLIWMFYINIINRNKWITINHSQKN